MEDLVNGKIIIDDENLQKIFLDWFGSEEYNELRNTSK